MRSNESFQSNTQNWLHDARVDRLRCLTRAMKEETRLMPPFTERFKALNDCFEMHFIRYQESFLTFYYPFSSRGAFRLGQKTRLHKWKRAYYTRPHLCGQMLPYTVNFSRCTRGMINTLFMLGEIFFQAFL